MVRNRIILPGYCCFNPLLIKSMIPLLVAMNMVIFFLMGFNPLLVKSMRSHRFWLPILPPLLVSILYS